MSVQDAVAKVIDPVYDQEKADAKEEQAALDSWKVAEGATCCSGVVKILDSDPDKAVISDEFANNKSGTRILAGPRIIISHTVQSAQITGTTQTALATLNDSDVKTNTLRNSSLVNEINAHYAGALTVRSMTYNTSANTLTLSLCYCKM